MMNEPKPFASLGPTLLARKGGARPAMRPQFATMAALGVEGAKALSADSDPEHDLDDLGWNDMGHEEHLRHEANVLPLTPSPNNPQTEAEAKADDEEARARLAEKGPDAEPAVRQQQREIAEIVAARSPTPAPATAKAAPAGRARPRRSAIDQGRRAAFTLRLDAQRHLKLRLASTVRNRSAQQLVTEALDHFLAELPELETLAAQVSRDAKHN